MSDYTSIIETKFTPYARPTIVEAINNMMNELDSSGFGNIVKYIRSQKRELAKDFLFEAWICQMLRRNPEIENLIYEPDSGAKTPDFRLMLQGMQFDIEVKRVSQLGNIRTKEEVRRKFDKDAGLLPVPMFMDLSLTPEFESNHKDSFFYHIKRNLLTFAPRASEGGATFPTYQWPEDGVALARYSFRPCVDGAMSHLVIGEFEIAGDWLPDAYGNIELEAPTENTKGLRNALLAQLKSSEGKFALEPGSTQVNIVILQGDKQLLLTPQTIASLLYGDPEVSFSDPVHLYRNNRGLFRPDTFSKICGLIVVPPDVSYWQSGGPFEGTYYAHPRHLNLLQRLPRPFAEVSFHIETTWRKDR